MKKAKWDFLYTIGSEGIRFTAWLFDGHHRIAWCMPSKRLNLTQLERIIRRMEEVKKNDDDLTVRADKTTDAWHIKKKGSRVYLVLDRWYKKTSRSIPTPKFSLSYVKKRYNEAKRKRETGEERELKNMSNNLESAISNMLNEVL